MGLVQSISCNDFIWLERSGSLIVVIGLLFAWRDHVTTLGDVKAFYKSQLDSLKETRKGSRPKGIINGAMYDHQTKEIENASKKPVELTALMIKRVRATEMTILISGTILWGYGGVVGCYMFSLYSA